MAPASSLLHYQADLLLGRIRRIPIQRARSGSEKIKTADRQEFWNEIWSGPIEARHDLDQLLIENTRSLTPGKSLDIGCAIGGNVFRLAG